MEIDRNPAFTGETEQIHLNVSEVAYAHLDADWNCRNARAPITRVYFVCAGEGEIRYGAQTMPLTPGNIYIIPGGLAFSYACSGRLEKLYCHVSLLRCRHEDLFEGYPAPIALRDRPDTIAAALACFGGGALGAVRLRAILYAVLYEALAVADIDPGAPRVYGVLTRRVMQYVDTHLSARLSAGEIAAALITSESTLQKTFRREVGTSLGRYITDSVLAAAERELRLTARPVREISDAFGFCDRFYFSRLFCDRYGLPPARYRKNVNLS